MTDALQAANTAVESFDLNSFLSEKAAAPEDSVTVYLDAGTAYQIDALKRRHDEWQREEGEALERRRGEPRGIADEPEVPDDLVNVDERIEALQEQIKDSGLRVYMRGVGDVEQRLIANKVIREHPISKNATDEERALREKERGTLTLEAWLQKAITKVVRVSDGAVAPAPSADGIAALHTALYETEWNKLVGLFDALSYANGLFEQAVDAGFPGGGTVEG